MSNLQKRKPFMMMTTHMRYFLSLSLFIVVLKQKTNTHWKLLYQTMALFTKTISKAFHQFLILWRLNTEFKSSYTSFVYDLTVNLFHQQVRKIWLYDCLKWQLSSQFSICSFRFCEHSGFHLNWIDSPIWLNIVRFDFRRCNERKNDTFMYVSIDSYFRVVESKTISVFIFNFVV